MSLNRLLAFSSSRVGEGSYLETAAPVINCFLGQQHLTIAFIPFALVSNDYVAFTALVNKGLENLPYTI